MWFWLEFVQFGVYRSENQIEAEKSRKLRVEQTWRPEEQERRPLMLLSCIPSLYREEKKNYAL